MIVAKPKKGTLFSLGLFIVLAVGLATYITYTMLQGQPVWYQYALVALLYPIGIGLAIKVVWGYKVITVGKNKISIKYPIRFQTVEYTLKQLISWKEAIVKTGTGTFKEVSIKFDNGKVLNLSYQEHTDYPQVIQYLKKKCPRKAIK
ncbi:hypothetical protein [Fulvivirga sediminis]|uniref:Uncharacterized protein n=1 Tax=Fulvivirga sediminis TaxID=2803949 RepID=A0A937K1F8_9BACT|nr:hypothetical protein [Fulvivirga sediminis]MBL3656622.1 hypothetical protein [Fulvivirga sediminis]